MRDHYYVDDFGNRMLVSQMPTQEILEVLQVGAEITDDDDGGLTANDFLERLWIELVARSLR